MLFQTVLFSLSRSTFFFRSISTRVVTCVLYLSSKQWHIHSVNLMSQRTNVKPVFNHVQPSRIECRRGLAYVCVVVTFLHLHVICSWMNCICPGEFAFAAPLWLNRQTAPLIQHQLGWVYPSCLWALLPVYLKQEEEGEYNQGSSLLYIRLRGTLRLFYGGGQ